MRGFWEGFTVSAGDRIKNNRTATKRWRENNKERYLASCKAYSQKWADENREKVRERQRRYYYRSIEKQRARKQIYQKLNKAKTTEAARRYRTKRKAIEQKAKCTNCESLSNSLYCSWCIKTYTPMKLLGKRIILRKQTQEAKSTIILATPKESHFYTCTVVAAGNETTTKVGAKALVAAFQVGEVEWEGEKLLMCAEEELIGIE